jgi:hypothetical protein
MSSSKNEIALLLTNEIKATIEYQEVLLLKQYIIDDITRPSVSLNVVYTYSQPININIFKLAFQVEFGFNIGENLNDNQCVIDMMLFLQ